MAASSGNKELEFPFNSDREYELRLGNSFHSKGGPKTAFHTIRCKIEFPCYLFCGEKIVSVVDVLAFQTQLLQQKSITYSPKLKIISFPILWPDCHTFLVIFVFGM